MDKSTSNDCLVHSISHVRKQLRWRTCRTPCIGGETERIFRYLTRRREETRGQEPQASTADPALPFVASSAGKVTNRRSLNRNTTIGPEEKTTENGTVLTKSPSPNISTDTRSCRLTSALTFSRPPKHQHGHEIMSADIGTDIFVPLRHQH